MYNSNDEYDRLRWANFVALSSAAYAISQRNKEFSEIKQKISKCLKQFIMLLKAKIMLQNAC